jgi:hypothetical protein
MNEEGAFNFVTEINSACFTEDELNLKYNQCLIMLYMYSFEYIIIKYLEVKKNIYKPTHSNSNQIWNLNKNNWLLHT